MVAGAVLPFDVSWNYRGAVTAFDICLCEFSIIGGGEVTFDLEFTFKKFFHLFIKVTFKKSILNWFVFYLKSPRVEWLVPKWNTPLFRLVRTSQP